MLSRIGKEERKVATDKRGERSVSVRSIIVSLVFLFFLAFVFTRGELTYGELNAVLELDNPIPNSGSLGPVILLVILLNPLLRMIGKRFQFSSAELLTIYAVLLIGAPIIGVGLLAYVPYQIMGLHGLSLINAKTYGSVLDRFSTLILPKSDDAIWGFLYGDAKVPWGDWIMPMLIWMVFWSVVFFWMVCIASLVRKQWTEYEHLRYPIAEVSSHALNVRDVKKEYSSTKLLWIGAVGSAVFILLERLSYYFPAFPQFNVRWIFDILGWKLAKLSPVIDEAFRVHWWMPTINPSVVGVGYLVRTDLLFSVWFFYILNYATIVLHAGRGLIGYQGIPNVHVQTIGAYVALGLYLIWFARHEISNICKKAFLGNKANVDDSDEPLSYRLVVFGGLAAVCFIVVFSALVLHVSPLITLILLFFIFVGCLTVARMRGDAGIGWGRLYGIPFERYIIPVFGGSSVWDMTSVVNYSGFLYNAGKIGLGAATASSLELYKMADMSGMKKKTMAAVIMFGFVAAYVIGFGVVLPYIYTNGGMMLDSHFVNWGYNGWWIHGTILPESGQAYLFEYSPIKLGYFLISGIVTAMLMFLSTNFTWWPLHPMGYVMATFGWYFVGGFFIAWLVKILILRYGGFETYKRLTPLFTGLIIGQVFAEMIDGLVKLVTML